MCGCCAVDLFLGTLYLRFCLCILLGLLLLLAFISLLGTHAPASTYRQWSLIFLRYGAPVYQSALFTSSAFSPSVPSVRSSVSSSLTEFSVRHSCSIFFSPFQLRDPTCKVPLCHFKWLSSISSKKAIMQRWEFIKENKKTRTRSRKWSRKKESFSFFLTFLFSFVNSHHRFSTQMILEICLRPNPDKLSRFLSLPSKILSNLDVMVRF